MAGDKGKRSIIPLSSSEDDDDDDCDDFCDISSDSSLYSDEGEYELVDDDDDDCKEVEDDQQSLYNQVIRFLQEKRDLQELSVRACKAYLRRNGLRVSGNKGECMKRVQEHWRIKDGKAEVLYPRSSFFINCKGDVCKGDTVLFTQKVFGSFDKVTRNGKLLGRRTVAGRVVKESYGAAKQQHTFTVEVLWTKGLKKLPALFPLLVKGRNLYRLNTFRQLWKNEGERKKVLAEKHRRGAAARLNRVKRRKGLSTDKGLDSQKVFNRPSNISCINGGKHFDRGQEISTSKYSTINCQNQQYNVKQRATQHTGRPEFSQPLLRHEDIAYLSRESHYRSMSFHSATVNFLGDVSYHRAFTMPAAQYDAFGYKSFYY